MPHGEPLQSTVEVLHESFRQEETSFLEDEFMVREPDQMSGELPCDKIEAMVPGSGEEAVDDFYYGDDDETEKDGAQTKMVPFSSKKHAGHHELTDKEKAGEEALDTNARERYTRKSRQEANYGLDGHGSVWIYSSGNFDKTGRNATWEDDTNTSDPLGKWTAMFDAVPGADSALIGQNVLSNLQKHAAVTAILGDQERYSDSAILEALEGYDRRCQGVSVLEREYNISPDGKPANIGYLFSDYIFVYNSRDVMFVLPDVKKQDKVRAWEDEDSDTENFKVVRWGVPLTANGLGTWMKPVGSAP